MKRRFMWYDDITRRGLLKAGLGIAAGIAAPRLAAAFSNPAPPPSDLDVALCAARWIRQSRIETTNGVAWPSDPLDPRSVRADLYGGISGVVLLYLELFDA